MEGSLREFALAHNRGVLGRSYSMGAALAAGAPSMGGSAPLAQLRANLAAFGLGSRPAAPDGAGAASGAGGWSFDWGAKRGGAEGMPSLLPWGAPDGDAFSYPRRLRSFALLLGLGALNFAAAGFCLPLLLLRPGKFSLFFTLGNCLVLASFAVLRGAREQAGSLLGGGRLRLGVAYLASMALTLYAALVARSRLLVLCSAGAQLAALCYFAASHLPGGTRALRLVVGVAGGALGRMCSLLGGACCGRRRGGACAARASTGVRARSRRRLTPRASPASRPASVRRRARRADLLPI